MNRNESQNSSGSPVKHVEFQRGNSRVVSNVILSPHGGALRKRQTFTPMKYRVAQQQSRKPSNPILRAPKLEPPTEIRSKDDDEWQDIEAPPAPDVGTPKPSEKKFERTTNGGSPQKKKQTPPAPGSDISSTETNTSSNLTSTSFLGFSPSAAKASFMRKLHKHYKGSSLLRHESPTPEEKYTHLTATYNPSYQHQLIFPSNSKPFWLDPSTPGLLALYLQVGFNLAMVSAIIYGIGIFYSTIRNDVNLKVEEYSVDIVDQIAKCSFEYLRNGCEPSKRVPAMEAACQQWERCMQRDPKEVGRAKVSAETFGTIIEAFLKPIGIKSMVFLIFVFAGSFLLVNFVFSSRIGPRFSGDFAHSHDAVHPSASTVPPPPPPPQFQPQASYMAPPPAAQSSFMYSPSPRLASPRHRQTSFHATLQSSPLHRQPYTDYPF